MAKRDFYEILGLAKSASEQEIKTAYRKLAKQFHPDVNKNADAEEKFKEINEAASILLDKEKRAQYDQFGHNAFDSNGFGTNGGFSGFNDFFSNMGGMDFGDIFSDLFGQRGSSSSRRGNSKGQDVGVEVTLTLKELIFGVDKSVTLNLLKKCFKCNGVGAEDPKDVHICNKCNGAGQIIVNKQMGPFQVQNQVNCDQCNGLGKQINNRCKQCHGKQIERVKEAVIIPLPKGLRPGQQIVMRQAGHASYEGGVNGDLYITIDVVASKVFELTKTNDLIMHYNVSYLDAILGNEITINTLDGLVKLKIPRGINSGEIIKVHNKGLYKNQNTDKRGDLLIRMNISVPSSISKEEKKLIKQIEEMTEFKAKNNLSD